MRSKRLSAIRFIGLVLFAVSWTREQYWVALAIALFAEAFGPLQTILRPGSGPAKEDRLTIVADAAWTLLAFTLLWNSGRLDGFIVALVASRLSVDGILASLASKIPLLATDQEPLTRLAKIVSSVIVLGGTIDVALRSEVGQAVTPTPIFSVLTILLAVVELRLLFAHLKVLWRLRSVF